MLEVRGIERELMIAEVLQKQLLEFSLGFLLKLLQKGYINHFE
jgi:hypothetical protein